MARLAQIRFSLPDLYWDQIDCGLASMAEMIALRSVPFENWPSEALRPWWWMEGSCRNCRCRNIGRDSPFH